MVNVTQSLGVEFQEGCHCKTSPSITDKNLETNTFKEINSNSYLVADTGPPLAKEV